MGGKSDSLAWVEMATRVTNLENRMNQAMSRITDLETEVSGLRADNAELHATIDTEHQQVADAFQAVAETDAAQDAAIAALQAAVEEGGTPEQQAALLQEVKDARTEARNAINKVAAIYTPAVVTPIPEPEPASPQ